MAHDEHCLMLDDCTERDEHRDMDCSSLEGIDAATVDWRQALGQLDLQSWIPNGETTDTEKEIDRSRVVHALRLGRWSASAEIQSPNTTCHWAPAPPTD